MPNPSLGFCPYIICNGIQVQDKNNAALYRPIEDEHVMLNWIVDRVPSWNWVSFILPYFDWSTQVLFGFLFLLISPVLFRFGLAINVTDSGVRVDSDPRLLVNLSNLYFSVSSVSPARSWILFLPYLLVNHCVIQPEQRSNKGQVGYHMIKALWLHVGSLTTCRLFAYKEWRS